MKAAAKKTTAPRPRFEYSARQWRSLASFIADEVDKLEVHIQAIDVASSIEQRDAIAGMREVAGNLRMGIADIRLNAPQNDEVDEPETGARESKAAPPAPAPVDNSAELEAPKARRGEKREER